MVNQRKLDEAYISMAENLSQLSHAKKLKVGCLIVKDTQIISEGYNGTPRNFDNDCEYYDHMGSTFIFEDLVTKPEVLHAESNAICKLAKSTQSSDGATLYTTHSPCFDCAKLIIQAGIKRVVYANLYRSRTSFSLLEQAGVQIDYLHIVGTEPRYD